ncbi:MAG: 16S rRNA (cytidine(1402)-2'-O)-methyltransferase [Clostridiaceae bacterium]|nr:16S rRNA (cytidine(1402)-2'-O)-methyltransferase [Clostridiaceae bacterium]
MEQHRVGSGSRQVGKDISRGSLTLVATPIGNFDDISVRALETLKGADLIAAEDTRVTIDLLKHFGLGKPLESYHEHNRVEKGEKLLALMISGKKIALVSDAGMPCISDPGEMLVRTCIENDIPVTVIPGPNAALTALSASGLDTKSFVFEGFLSVENKVRREQLERLATENRTAILYEAPHRLRRTLADLQASGLEQRQVVLARELTKRYEEWLRMSVDEACKYYEQEQPRGEFVIVLEGMWEYGLRCPPDPADVEAEARELMRSLLDQGLSVREAAKQASASGLMKKNEFYKLGLDLQS